MLGLNDYDAGQGTLDNTDYLDLLFSALSSANAWLNDMTSFTLFLGANAEVDKKFGIGANENRATLSAEVRHPGSGLYAGMSVERGYHKNDKVEGKIVVGGKLEF